ncbi:hypothetical protein ElyMa_003457600 [Elysia marginata]|uniref:Receptor ligand binding region domain-containing protein n=1 Tax=Elysia marginata TaxID=1093978 RepID=A0AAV4E9B8_9GAST|nr:hypothetical protein ElyMa_003457600 [Elysia marginata]
MAVFPSLGTNLFLGVLLAFLLADLSDAQKKLKVGVPESSMATARSALEDSNLAGSLRLLPIRPEDKTSSFYSINRTYMELSSLEIDAVVGPFDMALDLVTESLAIPYLCTTFDFSLVKKHTTFEMLPDTVLAGQAMLDVIKAYGWTQIALFHDDYKGKTLM